MNLAPRTIELSAPAHASRAYIEITRSGNWVNVTHFDLPDGRVNSRDPRANRGSWGYSLKDKRWSYGKEPPAAILEAIK